MVVVLLLLLTNGNVLEPVESVNEGPDNSDVDPHIGELAEAEVVLHDADNVAPDAVYGGVDGEVAVGVGPAAVYGVAALAMVGVQPAQQRASLVRGGGEPNAPLARLRHPRLLSMWPTGRAVVMMRLPEA